jgi:PAS domain S-box-containing protein
VRAEENKLCGLQHALVGTLYTSTRSLAAGAMAGTIVGLTVATVGSDPVAATIGLAIPLVGALRVSHALHFRKRGALPQTRSAELVYEGGAWLFSALVGLLAFFTLSRSDHPGLHLLVACLAVGYAAGICARNAGRPHIARGQLALSVLPASVALAMSDDPVRWILAAVNLVFVAGLAEITSSTHRIFVSALEGAHERAEEGKRALGNLPVMAWTADSAGDTTYQSEQWAEFMGTREIGSGNARIGLVHAADWPTLDSAWSNALKAGSDFAAQYRLLHRTGKYRWVLSRARPERDASGKIVKWHGVCIDIDDPQVLEKASTGEGEAEAGAVERRMTR